MPNDVKKVVVGSPLVTGAAFAGLSGVLTLPTTEVSALAAGYKLAGYVGEEGVTQSIGADSSTIVAWGGDTVRTVQSSHDVTFALTMLETNEITQGVYYGTGNVVKTPSTVSTGEKLAIKVTSEVAPLMPWVFEIKDGLRRGRIVLPSAQVTERGDVTYVHSDAVQYPITLTAYPDSTGVKAYIYWDDGVFTP